MAGHTVTPYNVTAVRKHARAKETKEKALPLASIGKDAPVDLLDAVQARLLDVEPVVSGDSSQTFRPVAIERGTGMRSDRVAMLFATDVSGEREVVHDESPERKVIFTKDGKHVTRFYSNCLLWRPADETAGVLLIHLPWGRGGSRAHVLKLMQRAVDATEGAKAKLRVDPMIPQKMLARWLRRANATRITYTRTTGVTTTFGQTRASAQAELDLVVKGSATAGFRDALTKALQASASRDRLFTLSVRDENAEGGLREETFEDVSVDIPIAGGVRRYSMRDDTVPTVGFNMTPSSTTCTTACPRMPTTGRRCS